jgi:hypothetical protein
MADCSLYNEVIRKVRQLEMWPQLYADEEFLDFVAFLAAAVIMQ